MTATSHADDAATIASGRGVKSASFLHRNLRLGARKDAQLAFWLLLAMVCGFLAYVARLNNITHDAFHEMALFREALVLGQFPINDVFAYTPTVNPTVHHEWATGALLYLVTVGSGLGLAGLAITRFLLIAALWLLLYRVARMRGAHPYVFAAIAFFAFPVFWVGFSTLRAQLFTLVFIAAQLWMQELDCRGRRWWVFLWVPMLIAWLNIHAGFVVGLGLIAFHGIERFVAVWCRKGSLKAAITENLHLILAAPVAVMALPLNPYGWQYVPYLVRAISMERPLIREWLPIWNTHAPVYTMLIFSMSVAFFVYAQRVTKLSRLRGAAFLALCTYMAIKHIRHGSIYGVVWLAYVPAWISRTQVGKSFVAFVQGHREPTIRMCQGMVAATLLFCAWNQCWLPRLPATRVYSTACYPVGAVDYLQKHGFHGNLWTPFYAGSYVSWMMFPDVKVSFDGRYEVAYQEHIMPEHNQFRDAIGDWWSLLDKYPTDAVLVHKLSAVAAKIEAVNQDGAVSLPTEKQWQIVYEDDSFILLTDSSLDLPRENCCGVVTPDGARAAFVGNRGHWKRGLERRLGAVTLAERGNSP